MIPTSVVYCITLPNTVKPYAECSCVNWLGEKLTLVTMPNTKDRSLDNSYVLDNIVYYREVYDIAHNNCADSELSQVLYYKLFKRGGRWGALSKCRATKVN